MDLQRCPLKVSACPTCPLLEECHSLVTEWALAPCVYHLREHPHPSPTVTKATGPGKDTDPWPGQSHSSFLGIASKEGDFVVSSPEIRYM